MTLKYVLRPINNLEEFEKIFDDFNNSGLMKQKNCNFADMLKTERGQGYDITANYKGNKIAISLDDFKVMQVSFPLENQNLQKELLPVFIRFIQTKPIGFYDAKCTTNPSKSFRSFLFDKLHPENTRVELEDNLIAPEIQLFAEKNEEYKVVKTGVSQNNYNVTDAEFSK